MELHADTILGFIAVIGLLWRISSKIAAHLVQFERVCTVQRKHTKALRVHRRRLDRVDPPPQADLSGAIAL